MSEDNTLEYSESQLEGVIRLLTFNIWGLKYVSTLRRERLKAVAERLSDVNEKYDVVVLQEVWCEEDWLYIDKRCKRKYGYRRRFKSGIIAGPGLCILSKIPISETFLYRFPINGRPSAFFRGDWFVGKSVAVTLLKSPGKGLYPIAILNSHMHAPYGKGDSSYACHRACQAWDFAKLIRMLKRSGYAVIQVGDLNSTPGSLPYKLFTVEGRLSDSWEVCCKQHYNISEVAQMEAPDQIELAGVTAGSPMNTWNAHKEKEQASRLDFALVDSDRISVTEADVKFTEILPSPYNCSYSDHFALSVKLNVLPQSSSEQVKENSLERIDVYRELLSEIEQYLSVTIPYQAFWRKWHFILSILVVVACHIVIIFASIVAPFSCILISLLSTITGITGVLNGLIWYFGVRSESRAIQEVKLEVEDMFSDMKTE